MTKTRVKTAIDGSHAVITFATDDGVNVLSSDVLRTFAAAVARVGKDPRVRTTAIAAEGKVFLAGADIKEMSALGHEDARSYGALGQEVLSDLAAMPSITVAAINGAAMGGGLELAIACDFRVAVKSAKLGLPETSLGLVPGWGGFARLPKLIGPSRAKKLMFSAIPISAEDGLAFGLVDEVVNSVEDLGHRVAALCKSFRRSAPAAVALIKRAIRDGDDLSAFADCFETPDCREGLAAFLEKRPANWMEQA